MIYRHSFIAAATAALSLSAFAQEATPDTWMQAASTKTVEQVRAELFQARKDGTIRFGSTGYLEKVPSVKSREQVRTEVQVARQSGEFRAINDEAYAFAPVRSDDTRLARTRRGVAAGNERR